MEVFMCTDREDSNAEMPDDVSSDIDIVATDDRSDNVQYSDCEQSDVKFEGCKCVRSEFDIPEINTDDERSDALPSEADVPEKCSESTTSCSHEENSLIDVLKGSHVTRDSVTVCNTSHNTVESSSCDIEETPAQSVAVNEPIDDNRTNNMLAAEVQSPAVQDQLEIELGDDRLPTSNEDLSVVKTIGKQSPVDSSSDRITDTLPDQTSISVDALSLHDDINSGTVAMDNSVLEMEDVKDVNVNKSLMSPSDENSKKKGFRVRFDEDRIVSSYLEPLLPWQDASKSSTSEMMTAYREACRLMGVKPLPKVVQQLEAIVDFNERHELLTLRGENIDGKVCETLEEVFRRVRFRSIDIEATSLDEDTAVTMFDLLDYYESCQRLNISYNKNLGIRGWQACARFIKKTASLDMLEARGCSFNDPALTLMGRSLRMGSNIKSLHLENCFLSGRHLMLLVAAIKFNETLRELFLADNKLTPSDGVQLGSLLKSNRTLSLLDLRSNLLQDVGLSHICDGLSEQTGGSGLNTLVVWNNQITYDSMNAVARALTLTSSIETINLGHNNITNEGIHRLKDGLLHNKSLLRIGLQSAKISCEGAVALAEFIAESTKLLRLDLRGNYIRTGGLMALMLSLKVNQSVTRLDLDPEPKKEAGIRDYAEQQRRMLSDIATYTARNLSILAGTADQGVGEVNRQLVVESCSEGNSSQQQQPPPGAPSSESSSPRPMLNLPMGLLPRTESLDSPAYVPLSTSISSPLTDGNLMESIIASTAVQPQSLPVIPASSMVDLPEFTMQTSVAAQYHSPTDEYLRLTAASSEEMQLSQSLVSGDGPVGLVASVQSETSALMGVKPVGSEMSKSVSVESTCDPNATESTANKNKPSEVALPSKAAAAVVGKTSKFAETVRRKFTVRPVALASSATTARPTADKVESTGAVVVFKKVTSPDDGGELNDDRAQVCFVDKGVKAASNDLPIVSAVAGDGRLQNAEASGSHDDGARQLNLDVGSQESSSTQFVETVAEQSVIDERGINDKVPNMGNTAAELAADDANCEKLLLPDTDRPSLVDISGADQVTDSKWSIQPDSDLSGEVSETLADETLLPSVGEEVESDFTPPETKSGFTSATGQGESDAQMAASDNDNEPHEEAIGDSLSDIIDFASTESVTTKGLSDDRNGLTHSSLEVMQFLMKDVQLTDISSAVSDDCSTNEDSHSVDVAVDDLMKSVDGNSEQSEIANSCSVGGVMKSPLDSTSRIPESGDISGCDETSIEMATIESEAKFKKLTDESAPTESALLPDVAHLHGYITAQANGLLTQYEPTS